MLEHYARNDDVSRRDHRVGEHIQDQHNLR